MTSLLLNKVAISVIGLISVSVPVVWIFCKKYGLGLFDKDDDAEDFYEVLFFDSKSIGCRRHFVKENDNKKACTLHSCSYYNLSRMKNYLRDAKKSMEVCLYQMTIRDLGELIVEAYKRGVKVRVITDEDMGNCSGSQMVTLRHLGIPVRHLHKSTTLMHHKFVVIDKQIVMTGSLNWTMQAICGNWENILITSQYQIVHPYYTEFERMWKELE